MAFTCYQGYAYFYKSARAVSHCAHATRASTGETARSPSPSGGPGLAASSRATSGPGRRCGHQQPADHAGLAGPAPRGRGGQGGQGLLRHCVRSEPGEREARKRGSASRARSYCATRGCATPSPTPAARASPCRAGCTCATPRACTSSCATCTWAPRGPPAPSCCPCSSSFKRREGLGRARRHRAGLCLIGLKASMP